VDGGGGGGGQPQVGGLDLGAWGKVVLEEVAGCHSHVFFFFHSAPLPKGWCGG